MGAINQLITIFAIRCFKNYFDRGYRDFIGEPPKNSNDVFFVSEDIDTRFSLYWLYFIYSNFIKLLSINFFIINTIGSCLRNKTFHPRFGPP